MVRRTKMTKGTGTITGKPRAAVYVSRKEREAEEREEEKQKKPKQSLVDRRRFKTER